MDLHAYIGRLTKFRWPLFALIVLIPVLGGCNAGPLSAGNLIEQLLLGLILGPSVLDLVPDTIVIVQIADIGIGGRYIAGLHGLKIFNGFFAGGLFNGSNKIH